MYGFITLNAFLVGCFCQVDYSVCFAAQWVCEQLNFTYGTSAMAWPVTGMSFSNCKLLEFQSPSKWMQVFSLGVSLRPHIVAADLQSICCVV